MIQAAKSDAATATRPAAAPREFFTTVQAAEYLNIPRDTLATWRSTGAVKLPYAKIGGKTVRYRKQDLDAFVEARMRTAAAPVRSETA